MTSITITGFITYKGVSYTPGQVITIATSDARALVNAGYAQYNTGGGTDTTAPTAPGSVTAAANSATSVTVTWTAATDAVGVAGYQVLRNGGQIGSTTTATTYTDTTASASTTYTYSVRALDAAGNVSVSGTAAPVTTPGGGGGGDTTAPTAPSSVAAVVNSATSVTVNWAASTDAVGVTGYRVYRDGGQIGTTSGALTYTDGTTAAGGTYVYSVRAVDAAGNVSNAGTASSVTTPGADTTAPTAPTSVTATANSATSAVVTWTASTDAVGVVGYRIFRGGVLVGTTTLVTSFVDAGLSPSTAYVFSVRAIDAAGNLSNAGTAASVTTPSGTSGGTPDTTAPTAPTSVTATANSPTSVVVLWAASTDAVGVAGYQVLRGGVLVGSTNALSYTDAGLAASTAYVYSVKAYDAAGNLSAAGTAPSVTTPAASTGGSLTVQDESVTVAAGVTQVDFQGAGVTAAAGSGKVIVTIPGGGSALTVQDENANVSTAVTQIDFQGPGVTATAGTGEVIVTIPGGGGTGITVQDENGTIATGVTQIDFQGAGVTATAGTGEVVVTVPAVAAGAGIVAQDEGGTAFTARSKINFVGGAVTAVDNAASDRVDVSVYNSLDVETTTAVEVFPGWRSPAKRADARTVIAVAFTLSLPSAGVTHVKAFAGNTVIAEGDIAANAQSLLVGSLNAAVAAGAISRVAVSAATGTFAGAGLRARYFRTGDTAPTTGPTAGTVPTGLTVTASTIASGGIRYGLTWTKGTHASLGIDTIVFYRVAGSGAEWVPLDLVADLATYTWDSPTATAYNSYEFAAATSVDDGALATMSAKTATATAPGLTGASVTTTYSPITTANLASDFVYLKGSAATVDPVVSGGVETRTTGATGNSSANDKQVQIWAKDTSSHLQWSWDQKVGFAAGANAAGWTIYLAGTAPGAASTSTAAHFQVLINRTQYRIGYKSPLAAAGTGFQTLVAFTTHTTMTDDVRSRFRVELDTPGPDGTQVARFYATYNAVTAPTLVTTVTVPATAGGAPILAGQGGRAWTEISGQSSATSPIAHVVTEEDIIIVTTSGV